MTHMLTIRSGIDWYVDGKVVRVQHEWMARWFVCNTSGSAERERERESQRRAWHRWVLAIQYLQGCENEGKDEDRNE